VFAGLVYALCAVTALSCAVLLLRGFSRSGARLLLWGSLCFAALTVNNVLVFVDLMLVPEMNLFTWSNTAAVAGMGVLVWGLIWDAH